MPNIINQEEHEYQDLSADYFENWNIPKIPVKEIYRSSFLTDSFRTDQIAKTVEQVYAITKQEEKCSLLSKNSIQKHLERGLKDKHILKALMLNIQTAGAITNMLEGSHPLALIYRIYYKCMKTNLNVHALVKSPKDKTVLIQSNTHANIQVPRTISWNDIKLPTSWVSENDSYPNKMQNNTIDVDYIKQYLDGTVRISFDQQRVKSPVKLKELDRSNSSIVSKPCYTAHEEFDNEETSLDLDELTPNDSVSQQGIDPSLGVLNKTCNHIKFDIDYDRLYNDYNSRKNKQNKDAFCNKYPAEQCANIISEWEQYVENNNIEIYFFDWLKYFYKPKITKNCKILSSVCTIKGSSLTFEKDAKIIKTSVNDLKREAKIVKKEIQKLKESPSDPSDSCVKTNDKDDDKKEYFQKWYTTVKLIVKDYQIEVNALLDTGADLNCIQQGLVPTMYFHKTTALLSTANNTKMEIKYKLPKVHVCKDKVCFKTTIVLTPELTDRLILGTPFICLLYPFTTNEEGLTTKPFGQQVVFKFLTPPEQMHLQQINYFDSKKNHLKYLQDEIANELVEHQLTTDQLSQRIVKFKEELEATVCSNLPSAFWYRKKYIVSLPYIKSFNESQIPTKSRPIQMNHELMETCKREIQSLLANGIIQKSKSPWSCPAFYVNKNAEKERGVPRLVINYKPLNDVLEWIRYPIPNKKDLINRLSKAVIFSKFDLKSGFWQIQIHPDDKYKTAFTTPFGHYEWNVMPFGLKNAPSEFQNVMNDIFYPFSHFIIVYIDDILIYSKSIDEHWKHLHSFVHTIKQNGLVISAPKIKLFQTKIRFLGYNIHQSKIVPIDRAIQFADKFPDEITDKNQLQRFLGSLNYIAEFYKDLRKICQPLFDRLKINPPPWTSVHTNLVKRVKTHVKTLPCLGIPTINSFKIIQTDASEIGYGGILLQKTDSTSDEQIVRFHSGRWNSAQTNYSTIKKEILSIVLCVSKFQDDILNQKFLIRVDCKSAKHVLEKDVQNIASKQIFARWQSILSIFDFDIQYIKGNQNCIPDFLTREFLLQPA
ncbi:hypothetical protein RHMOL_Rhmol10G0155500 [Rhododendron molle]|uniref:Uncharacterized protein n=1 Tax=Rhododendron molle TaxID=49168 RepID=A0ACC0M352_RHOML|nr:hypothetical protein RHMOL_Rhmol10G0155500 [Rhododendron molle]